MRPLMVLRQEPALADGTELFERFKAVGIKDLFLIGQTDAFEVGTLVGSARLNAVDADAAGGTPLAKDLREELWALVDANRIRAAMKRHPLR